MKTGVGILGWLRLTVGMQLADLRNNKNTMDFHLIGSNNFHFATNSQKILVKLIFFAQLSLISVKIVFCSHICIADKNMVGLSISVQVHFQNMKEAMPALVRKVKRHLRISLFAAQG